MLLSEPHRQTSDCTRDRCPDVIITRRRPHNVAGEAVELEVAVDGQAEQLQASETANLLQSTSMGEMLAAARTCM